MKIFIKETFTTPGYPEFKAGEIYTIDMSLAKIFIDRGLAVESTGTQEDKRDKSQEIKGKPKKS